MELLRQRPEEKTYTEELTGLEAKQAKFASKAEVMAKQYNATVDEVIYLYASKMDMQMDDYRQRQDMIDVIINSPVTEDLYWDVVEKTLLATKDTLTGLDNRRSMQSQLEKLASNYNRKQELFSFIFIDLDNFKAVNDTFGHGVGDAVLKAVAEAINSHVRATDLACRMGGEEMGVVVDGDKAASTILAERIRNSIEGIDVNSLGIDTTKRKNITASIGVAEYKYVPGFDNAQAIKLLIESADAALYQAKGNGKNQVVVA